MRTINFGLDLYNSFGAIRRRPQSLPFLNGAVCILRQIASSHLPLLELDVRLGAVRSSHRDLDLHHATSDFRHKW